MEITPCHGVYSRPLSAWLKGTGTLPRECGGERPPDQCKAELSHEKIEQLREREALKLTEAVRMLTECWSGRRQVHASSTGKVPLSLRAAINFMA